IITTDVDSSSFNISKSSSKDSVYFCVELVPWSGITHNSIESCLLRMRSSNVTSLRYNAITICYYSSYFSSVDIGGRADLQCLAHQSKVSCARLVLDAPQG